MGKRSYRPITGILLLDKAKGISSNKALQSVRRLYQADKAGHTGSLDPLATGMLPVCLGEATKVSAFLLDADKYYQTTAVLGKVSTTGDAEGELTPVGEVPHLGPQQWEALLDNFRGAIEQIPPMYSALKREGVPLYQLARKGISVERPPRSVFIHALSLDLLEADRLTLTVHCSKGTYIRTLVEDIGHALGCGAYVESLQRLSVSPFEGHQCIDFSALESVATQQGLAALDNLLIPADQALVSLPAVSLSAEQTRSLCYGQKVTLQTAVDAVAQAENTALSAALTVRMYQDEQGRDTPCFLGVGELHGQVLHPKRLFVQNT